ncbi:MAG: carboxypeptidase-like regulatory domain-containing protein [Planctomycetota bacterium]|nr:carboxypeptidase-like regulatory domain-containing protein [Planctomycetota bacterium]
MIIGRQSHDGCIIGCALLLLAMSANVSWSAPAAAPQESVTLHGKAVTVSGAPVPGVKVTLTDHSFGERPRTWTATSAAGGAFSVAVPADAVYRLTVSVEGPAGGTLAPCALAGAPTLSMFQEEPTPMTVLLAPATSRVTGTVSGPGGEPVPGATVTLNLVGQAGWQGLARWTAVTDRQGKYGIARLAAGSYVVGSVDPPAGTALIRLYSWKPGLVRRISLSGGAAAVEDFRLPAGARLQGRVLDEAGKPVAGAAVSSSLEAATEEGPPNMYQMPGQWYAGEAVTDAQGRYSVGGLTKETYRLTVQPPQGTGVSPAVLRGVNAPDAGDVELQDVTLYKEGKLVGVVVGPDGNPVAGAEASAAAPGLPDHEKPRAVTDAAGRFVLAGLPTGKYAVTVRPPAGSTSYEHVFEGISVVSGFALEHPLKLPEGAGVAGTVTDPDGKPVAGAAVNLSLGYQAGLRTVTDAGGRFKIAGVPPALRQAGPARPPPITLSVAPTETNAGLLGASAPLKDLAAGKTTQVDLKLGAGGAMTGVVKGPDGKPVPGCQVIAFQRMGPGGYSATSGGRTGRDGRFTVPHVPPGNWALSVIPPARAGLMLHAVPEKAVAAGKIETADVTLQNGGVVVGRVATTKGAPVSGAHVRLDVGRDGGLPYMPGMDNQNRYVALTDRDGAFRFEGLLPGTHKIHCSPIDPGLLVEAADVKVPPGGQEKVELAAHITGSLRGTVRGADGKPLGYELLSLKLQPTAVGAKGAYQPYPDAEGRFRLAGVIPGTYTLTVVLSKRGEERNLAVPAPLEVVIREAQETAADVKVGSK